MYTKGDLQDANECGTFVQEIDSNSPQAWYGKVIVHGNTVEDVEAIATRIIAELNGTDVGEQVPDYAAAFNIWQDEFIRNPQEFESSYDTAMRHLSEKLKGEEPSYGALCAELFQEYLNKVREGK